jgi:hypothetical protein
MIELYVKRIDRIFRNGNGPRLRVDILNIPSSFGNLSETIARYTDKISKITKSGVRQINSFQEKYIKNDEEPEEQTENVKKEVTKISREEDDDDDEIPSFNFESDSDDEEDDD